MRKLKYWEALSEGLVQAMEADQDIFVTGIAVDYPSGVYGSLVEANRRFGPDRIFDAPAMENALTGIAIGAAAMGKRPFFVHVRNDFLFLALDQMINLAAKWKYMYGGNSGNLPIAFRAITGKGWGQGATHSQSLQSVLAHFPGIKVVMPAFPRDAKGLTLAALQDDSPVIILEHRALYEIEGEVPEDAAPTPIGKAEIVRSGTDVTIFATSLMAHEAMIASVALSDLGIDVEVVNARSIRPLDEETLIGSVKKTGRLLAADTSWQMCGLASEVASVAAQKAFTYLKAPVKLVTLPDSPAPVSRSLEEAFYPRATRIARDVLEMLGRNPAELDNIDEEDLFKGAY